MENYTIYCKSIFPGYEEFTMTFDNYQDASEAAQDPIFYKLEKTKK